MFCGKHIFFKTMSKLQGIQMGLVGANQWKGGYQQYFTSGSKGSSFEPQNIEPDSYLGKYDHNNKLTHIDVTMYMHCSTAILPPSFGNTWIKRESLEKGQAKGTRGIRSQRFEGVYVSIFVFFVCVLFFFTFKTPKIEPKSTVFLKKKMIQFYIKNILEYILIKKRHQSPKLHLKVN